MKSFTGPSRKPWLLKKPLPAAAYTASMFEALSRIAQSADDGDVGRLAKECMTPGGLNELAMQVMDAKGGFAHVQTALVVVKNR